MNPLPPEMQEMILAGEKPRELYAVRVLVKMHPDENNLGVVALFDNTWVLFAHHADDARDLFRQHEPAEIDGNSISIERIVSIGMHTGPTAETMVLEFKKPTTLKAV